MNSTAQEKVSTASHTPGPYFIDDGLIRIEEQCAYLIDKSGTKDEWVSIGPGDEETPNQPACVVALCHPRNARLIAAAPELLEALKFAHNILEACELVLRPKTERAALTRSIEAARAAIAKATQS